MIGGAGMMDDYRAFKKTLDKHKKKVKKINELEMNEDGSKKSMFDVDIKMLKANLDPEVLQQLKSLIDTSEENKDKYLRHLEMNEVFEERELPASEFYSPSPISNYEFETLKDVFLLSEIKSSDVVHWTTSETIDDDVVANMKILKSLNIDISSTMNRIRMISTCSMIMMSPVMRQELDDMYDVWYDVYFEKLKTFCRSHSNKDMDIIEPDEEEEMTKKEESEEMDEDMYEFFSQYVYRHDIKIGGTLKQILSVWKSEDIFSVCAVVCYWLCGYIDIRREEDAYVCENTDIRYNISFDEHMKKYSEGVRRKKKACAKDCVARRMMKVVCRWMSRNRDMEDHISKFDQDVEKIKMRRVEELFDVHKTVDSMYNKMMNKNPIMKKVVSYEDEDNTIMYSVSTEDIRNILIAENNVFIFSDKYKKQKDFYNGKDLCTCVSMEEINSMDIEYWMLCNLLDSTSYTPLLHVSNHMMMSVYDNTIYNHIHTEGGVYNDIRRMYMDMSVLEYTSEHMYVLSCIKEYEKTMFDDIKRCKTGSGMDEYMRKAYDAAVLIYNKGRNCEGIRMVVDEDWSNRVEDLFRCMLYDDDTFRDDVLDRCVRMVSDERYIHITKYMDSSEMCDKMKESLGKYKGKYRADKENNEPVAALRCLQEDYFINKNVYYNGIYAESLKVLYDGLIKNIIELLDSIINLKNAEVSSNTMYNKVKEEVYDKVDKKLLVKLDEEYRFTYDKNGNIKNNMSHEDNNRWKKLRRFIPEGRSSKDKDDKYKNKMIVDKIVWNKCRRYIEHSYWKVQIGFVTWYALMVEGSAYEYDVCKILDKIEFHRCTTRDCAIKVLSIVSEHYKLYTDANYNTKFKEIPSVPYYVFSGADTIFGYSEENETDTLTWKEDVLNSIIDWVGHFEPEKLGRMSLNYDLECSMEHFLRDFKETYTPNNIKYTECFHHTLSIPSTKLGQFNKKVRVDVIGRNANYFEPDKVMEQNIAVLNRFNDYCKNFLRFSVDGSAQGMKIGVDKMYLIDENANLDEVDENKKVDLDQVQKDTTFPIDIQIEEPEMSNDDNEKIIKEFIRKKTRMMHLEEDYIRSDKEKKEKSLSKTLAFALGGKNLARLMMWCGGSKYIPELNIHLKVEKKKIRLVANSDVVSFTKQSFMYEWMNKAMADTTKELIYTLIHPRDKVKRVERFMECFRNEKWMCPMDLKDFQIQFGPVHHRTILRCLYRRAEKIKDEQLRREMVYVVSTLYDEMCRGVIFFRKSTEEDFTPVKLKLPPEKQIHIKMFECKIPPERDIEGIIEEDNYDEKDPEFDENGEVCEKKKEKYRMFMALQIKNGLLSGWKVTSIFGSIYNYSTNNLVNFWSMYILGMIPTDYATQGDDTHFKTRCLIGSLFHTAFINTIGKIAHPKKQYFSTRYTEFLKKTYDTWNKDIRYQPCRMISSLLFENENRETKSNNINSMKDYIDLWNQFLVRVPDVKRREYIRDMKYAQRSLRMKYKWQDEYEIEKIDKLVSTPEMVNSFLSGPLGYKEYTISNYGKEGQDKVELFPKYLKAEMFDSLLEFQHGVNVNRWNGIKSYTNNITSKLMGNSKVSISNTESFKVDLQKQIFYAISESLCEYKKKETKLGIIDQYELPPNSLDCIEIIKLKIDDIYNEIESNLVHYLNGKDIRTPYGQLMIMNNSFTKNIEGVLRKQGLNGFEVYDILSSFNGGCKLTQNMFSKLTERLDSSVVFKFALTKDKGVSVTRDIMHDEYIGTIALICSETLPLILKDNFNLKGAQYDENKQMTFIDSLILYLESDIYINRHQRLVSILRETVLQNILNNPF